jgi:hypothetical protein
VDTQEKVYEAEQALKKKKREDAEEERRYNQELRAADLKQRRLEMEQARQLDLDDLAAKRDAQALAHKRQLADQELQFEEQRLSLFARQNAMLQQQEADATSRRLAQEDQARIRRREEDEANMRHMEKMAMYRSGK